MQKGRDFTPATELWALSLLYLHLSFSTEVVEYETMSKDVNRSAYTRRILEIVGNIKKQKEEINKVGGCPVQLLSRRKWSLQFCYNKPVSYLVLDLLSKCFLFSFFFPCCRFLSTPKMFKRKLISYQGSLIERLLSLMSLYLGLVHVLDFICEHFGKCSNFLVVVISKVYFSWLLIYVCCLFNLKTIPSQINRENSVRRASAVTLHCGLRRLSVTT